MFNLITEWFTKIVIYLAAFAAVTLCIIFIWNLLAMIGVY